MISTSARVTKECPGGVRYPLTSKRGPGHKQQHSCVASVCRCLKMIAVSATKYCDVSHSCLQNREACLQQHPICDITCNLVMSVRPQWSKITERPKRSNGVN